VLTTLNAASHLVEASWTAADQPPALPKPAAFTAVRFHGGDNGPNPATVANYQGNGTSGLTALEAVGEIALRCIPDEVKAPLAELREALLLQCERLKDRFAVLQERDRQGNPENIRVNRTSMYGATYWPWIRVSDPRTHDTLLVPPGGHVLGIYARTDSNRGVHKAPANEDVRGIVTRDFRATDRGIRVGLGSPHRRRRPAMALCQRTAALHLPRGVNRQGDQVGGVRTQQRGDLGQDAPEHHYLP
jgi:phage tail sheath protein FI